VNGTGTMTVEQDGAEETPRQRRVGRPAMRRSGHGSNIVSLQMPEALRELLEQRARETDRSLSYTMRRALYAGLGVADPGDHGDRS